MSNPYLDDSNWDEAVECDAGHVNAAVDHEEAGGCPECIAHAALLQSLRIAQAADTNILTEIPF